MFRFWGAHAAGVFIAAARGEVFALGGPPSTARKPRALPGMSAPRADHAFRDPNNRHNRDQPRGEKRNRDANHPYTPHDCAGALRQRASQRCERTALVRDNIALAINLNRNVGRRVGFINLRACAVLALNSHVFHFA